MSRRGKELCGAPKAQGPRPWPIWPIRKSATGNTDATHFMI